MIVSMLVGTFGFGNLENLRLFSPPGPLIFHRKIHFGTFPDPICRHIFQLPEAVIRRHEFSQRADFTPSTQN